jgi:hypothetical protein
MAWLAQRPTVPLNELRSAVSQLDDVMDFGRGMDEAELLAVVAKRMVQEKPTSETTPPAIVPTLKRIPAGPISRRSTLVAISLLDELSAA